MSIKIYSNKQPFDLPTDFEIETEELSPLFNDRGTQTQSVSLPSTPRNRALLGQMHRLDTAMLPAQSSDVTVIDGSIIRAGRLNVTSAHRTDGFDTTIGFKEAIAINDFNSVKLSSLPNLTVYQPQGGVDDVIAHLNQVWTGAQEADYLVFQVCVAKNTHTEDDVDIIYYEWLNEMEDSIQPYHLLSDPRDITFLIDNTPTVVHVPKGFGITPFLRVYRLLELIFSSYGYTLKENPFAEHFQLRELVVLNNTVDTIVRGQIDYADLMPDCTINEFLQALYCRFGMVWFVDDKKGVHLKFLRDILNSASQKDVTRMLASLPRIEYSEAQRVVLKCGTSFEGAAPSAETFDDFLKPYHYTYSLDRNTDKALVYIPYLGAFVKMKSSNSYTIISTDLFPWDRGDDIPSFIVDSVDEAVSMIDTNVGLNWLKTWPAYITGSVKRYTVIMTSSVNMEEKELPRTPLSFLFGHEYLGAYYGITHIIDQYGNILESTVNDASKAWEYELTFVGERGHFMQFWREFDAMLRHSNHEVTSELNLSDIDIAALDLWRPVTIQGQSLLINTLRYTSPRHLSSPVEGKLRTIRLYQPYDLDAEQVIPVEIQKYYWNILNDLNDTVIPEYEIEMLAQLAREGFFSNREYSRSVPTTTVSSDIALFDDASLYAPPTDTDYTSGRRIYVQVVPVTINMSVYATDIGSTVEYLYDTYTKDTSYNIYLVAALL
jgi:hypothetical protein